MTLRELVAEALGVWFEPTLAADPIVTGVAQDSRHVSAGTVFVARQGDVRDGHRFVPQALDRGAIAVVGSARTPEHFGWFGTVPYIYARDDKRALAQLAACFYGHPSRALTTIGVTGTDGKTTTSYLLHHLLQAHHPTGLMSTASIRVGSASVPLEGHFTTPEAPAVQSLLARFRDAGLSHAVVESSSHGLAMQRLAEVDYDIAVWTNLTPEHLDYHGSFEAYRDAKVSLAKRAKRSVLNADDPSFAYFAEVSKKVIRYGVDNDAEWRAVDIRETRAGLDFVVVTGGIETPVRLPMVGRYNVSNALAALAAGVAVGIDLGALVDTLASFEGVPGRMQRIQAEPFSVIVDFAHTAPSLDKALSALRPQLGADGRLIVVIGAAGERDPGKRAPIARVSVEKADLALFTEEDSRSEDVDMILAQMADGAREAGGTEGEDFVLIPDRREAVRQAVRTAKPGDVVLLSGKGHEATLERHDEVLDWDEVAEAEAALRELSR